MLRVWSVTLKRLLLDKSILIALIVIPVIIIGAFTQFGLSNEGESKIKIAVLENVQDNSIQSTLSNHFHVFRVKDIEGLKSLVETRKVAAGLHIENQVITQVYALDLKVGQGILVLAQNPPSVLPKSTDQNKESVRKALIHFLINYMMFSMVMVASDIVSLKKIRVMARMHTLALSNRQIFSGLLLAFLTLLTIQIALVQVVTFIILGIPLTEHLLLGTGVLLLMMALVLSFGILVTRFTSQASLVPLFCNLMMIPLMMLSGTFMPHAPGSLLDTLKVFAPQYWVADALSLINSGQLHLMPHFAVLTAMTLFIFTLGTIQEKNTNSY